VRFPQQTTDTIRQTVCGDVEAPIRYRTISSTGVKAMAIGAIPTWQAP
jgi:hypothetical protein